MSKPKTFAFREIHLTLNKEQSEILLFLTHYYQEPGTHVVKKALERLYQSIKTQKDKDSFII